MYKELERAEINEILQNYICKVEKIYTTSGKRAVEKKYNMLKKFDTETAQNYYIKYINQVNLETNNKIKIATIEDLLIRVLNLFGKDISITNYLRFDCLLENFIYAIQDIISDNRADNISLSYSAKQYCRDFIVKILEIEEL